VLGGGVYRRQGSSLTRGHARARCCDTLLLHAGPCLAQQLLHHGRPGAMLRVTTF
jgi:hypothetical protein